MATDSQSDAASVKVDLLIKSQSQDDSIDYKSISDIQENANQSEERIQKIFTD
jgi:hypothetical protein